jgi:type IV pilus assembly protein PilW
MTTANRPPQQGFTLVEVLIALLVGGMVMTAVLTSFRGQHATYLAQDQVVEMQQNLRVALDMLTREIRSAGYDPAGLGAGFISADADELLFSRARDDDSGELEFIRYRLYTAYSGTARARSALGRTRVEAFEDFQDPSKGSNRSVAEYIEELEFYYLLADGSRTEEPAEPADIRGVQISLLARAANEDRSYTNNLLYFPASNPTQDEVGFFWGPFNDNFRRHLLIQTIWLRNQGAGL